VVTRHPVLYNFWVMPILSGNHCGSLGEAESVSNRGFSEA
jgi:hypothetical protein